ncbi:MAG: hypothetical protein ACYSYW_14405 [Planctomycetota bacterium]|jgi:hypothetical protein
MSIKTDFIISKVLQLVILSRYDNAASLGAVWCLARAAALMDFHFK